MKKKVIFSIFVLSLFQSAYSAEEEIKLQLHMESILTEFMGNGTVTAYYSAKNKRPFCQTGYLELHGGPSEKIYKVKTPLSTGGEIILSKTVSKYCQATLDRVVIRFMNNKQRIIKTALEESTESVQVKKKSTIRITFNEAETMEKSTSCRIGVPPHEAKYYGQFGIYCSSLNMSLNQKSYQEINANLAPGVPQKQPDYSDDLDEPDYLDSQYGYLTRGIFYPY